MFRFIPYTCVFFNLLLLFNQVRAGTRSSGDFYKSYDRLGCELVESHTICPATELNPDLAFDYETDAEVVNIMIEEARMNNASRDCLIALQTTYCSTITPRCFVNGSKDYGDARSACWKAIRTCPNGTLDEELCKSFIKVGMHNLSACVKPSTQINGTCPQPEFKMPKDKLDVYIRSSVEYENIGNFNELEALAFPNGTKIISPECVSKIKELYCLPFYCSEDGQQIIVEYTYDQCEHIVESCFTAKDELDEGRLRNISEELHEEYAKNCVFYPDITDGSGIPLGNTTEGSGIPLGSTTPPTFSSVSPPGNNVSTTPQQKTSTQASGKNVSTTAAQEIPGKNMSTTLQQKVPSTTLPGNTTSTTPGQNMTSEPPEVMTSHPKDTKPSTTTPWTTEVFETQSPTAGNERGQKFSNLMFLLFLVVSFHINV